MAPTSKGGAHNDPGEAAASAAAVADLLAHLAGTTQAMHASIARRSVDRLLPAPVATVRQATTTGIYGLVRAGIVVAGAVATATLGSVERTRTARPMTGTPRGRRLAGLVNGAVGDRLADRHPRLASTMHLRVDGTDVDPDRASLARCYPAASPTVVVFVHGVIETEEWWIGRDATAGFAARLTRDLGCTCVQVRYNSGRHVSENGADLALLLNDLVAAWPVPVRRIALVGHSMGGLVARSALHQAVERDRAWSRSVAHVVCLGTPHTGAPLERGANLLTGLLRRHDVTAPVAELLAARSAGIKDLRHGLLLRDDWQGADPDAARRTSPRSPYRPPALAQHSNLAATLAGVPGPLRDRIGDLLVPVASALAPVPAARAVTIDGLTHHDLLTHDAVYAQLAAWLRD